MIYITGDTHGEVDISHIGTKARKSFDIELNSNDYLIIAGDFGLPFSPCDIDQYNNKKGQYRFWINWLDKYPCKILFVDGNHDNHEWWAEQPVTKMFGGLVQIHPHSNNVIHLMRGQIYTIEDKTFFTMGGAKSIDVMYRKEHISWWKDEMPSNSEYDLAMKNLEANNMYVDYIITHCCGSSYLNYLYTSHSESDQLTSFFNHLEFDFDLKFKHWYFGHHHIDKKIDDKHTCVYRKILKIDYTL